MDTRMPHPGISEFTELAYFILFYCWHMCWAVSLGCRDQACPTPTTPTRYVFYTSITSVMSFISVHTDKLFITLLLFFSLTTPRLSTFFLFLRSIKSVECRDALCHKSNSLVWREYVFPFGECVFVQWSLPSEFGWQWLWDLNTVLLWRLE